MFSCLEGLWSLICGCCCSPRPLAYPALPPEKHVTVNPVFEKPAPADSPELDEWVKVAGAEQHSVGAQ